MSRAALLDQLATVSLFSMCSKKELQAIAKASDEIDLPAGRVLCTQGQAGREAFVIIEGVAEVNRNGKTIAEIADGAAVGELALLDHGPRTATVIAKSDLKVLVIESREFTKILDQAPGFSLKLLRSLAALVRQFDAELYG